MFGFCNFVAAFGFLRIFWRGEHHSLSFCCCWHLCFVFFFFFHSCPHGRQVDGVLMTREDYIQRVGQLVDGKILAGDASFKYAKVIRLTSAKKSKTSKPIQGIFTILNEYEQASCLDNFIRSPDEPPVISCVCWCIVVHGGSWSSRSVPLYIFVLGGTSLSCRLFFRRP